MRYDRFQSEAIEHIQNGLSCIVSAPTGAGKTAIAEHIIEASIENNTGVIYTAPIKALSNQKFRDFQKRFGEKIGILTGDISINPEAPVLIMTTEIFRNKILDELNADAAGQNEPHSLDRYQWVIFDEIHYIDNPERGTVWEEALMFSPKHMKVLGLSATIPNIASFSAWIESVHQKPVRTVIENNRPVPLHFFFQCQNRLSDKLESFHTLRFGKTNRLDSLIHFIKEQNGLPVLYFVFSRKRAEELARDLRSFDFLKPDEKKEITTLFANLCRRFGLENEPTADDCRPLIENGIAYHHAGMLPTLKEVIERLFTSRLIKVIFTTETFALGINMPSRSVVFDGLKKIYGRYARNLKTRDFYQMAGRAGRRGIDTEGFVYCRINPSRITLDEVKRTVFGKPEEVRSQFNNSYATLLNLYNTYQEKLFDLYPRSFHYFQSKKHERQESLRLIESKIKLLEESGFIKKGCLTDKGAFAKKIYGYEMILSELFEQGLLENLDKLSLGVLAAAIVFEPRKNQSAPHLSKTYRPLKKNCDDIYLKIKNKELRYRIYPVSKPPYFHLAASIEAWMKGNDFDAVLKLTDTDEGELVRYFRMSVQILREMQETPLLASLKEKIKETIETINRDIVDAEKQLRES